ncbi:MAG: chitobiase/beta-hexosaminidase C-terminal domain-containing protein [Pirellulales bacterium]|nr:chitobiase/beta-hexosaminidase C-terminal domain-containing protein [Pirellulales bacterium]
MRTTREGEVTFSREYHRLEEGKVVRCAMDLVAHAADWRGGVAFMSGQYPAYFESPNAGVQLLAGCGSYSSHAKVEDAERLMRMAYRVNWQASFDFPYMGMFIPPVSSDDESWIDFKEQSTSIGKIRSMVQSLRGRGFDTLSYFNVTEFGARTKYPAPARKAATDAELWHDSNDFLHYALGGAILPGADGKPIFSWEGCVVMDAGEKVYQDFLVEQARRHIERVPESAGIAIDRMDWLMEYNTQRDDGVSWHGDRPARALTQSWKQLMERLSPVFHDAGKVIFVNPMAARIDLMRSVDAFYDEHGQHPHSLNTCTLLALNKPYVAWTWELEEFDKNPDAYFQRHLHLGAFLTAPVPGNDHTILPNAKRDKFYCDYGPLLDTLRGKRWALLPHAVRVEGSKTLANLFEVPGGYVVPVTFGGEAAAADVVVRTPTNDPAQGRYRAWAIHPGANQPAKLSAETNPDGMKVSVPLVRGCAMLVLEHTWMSPSVRNFHDTAAVKLGTVLESGELRYTLDGSEPTAESPLYSEPIKLSKTTLVRAAAFQKGQRVGRVLEREYVKLEGGKGEL